MHDFIICLEQDAEQVKNTIQHYFGKEYFLHPSMDIDYLVKNQLADVAAPVSVS